MKPIKHKKTAKWTPRSPKDQALGRFVQPTFGIAQRLAKWIVTLFL